MTFLELTNLLSKVLVKLVEKKHTGKIVVEINMRKGGIGSAEIFEARREPLDKLD